MENNDSLSKNGSINTKKTGGPTLACPRHNMQTALNVAKITFDRAGGKCNPEQMAAFLGYKGSNNGAFIARIASTRMFGFIEYDRASKSYIVTNLAKTILAPVKETEAKKNKVETFKSIDLFNSLLKELKGTPLPSDSGLKNLLVNNYNFPNKKASKVLRVFKESAEYSGFFECDNNRLIEPVIENDKGEDELAGSYDEQNEENGNGAQNPSFHDSQQIPPNIHIAILGLLKELPPIGNPWDTTHKERFMAAFKTTIDFIYPDV